MNAGRKLVSSIGDQNLEKLLEGALEVGLDTLLNEGIARDLPVFGTVFAIGRAFGSYRDYKLGLKVIRFLQEISKLSWAERARTVSEIAGDEEKKERLGEVVIDLLDRANEEEKAALLASLFVGVGRGSIQADQFVRLATMLNNAFLGDLIALASTRSADGLIEERRFALQASGFLIFSINMPFEQIDSQGSTSLRFHVPPGTPMQLHWKLTSEAEIILDHCFGGGR